MAWLRLLVAFILTLLTCAAHTTQSPTLYIAADLHNNAATIPGFVTETSELAQRYGPSSLFVTVYESDSSDDTFAARYASSL